MEMSFTPNIFMDENSMHELFGYNISISMHEHLESLRIVNNYLMKPFRFIVSGAIKTCVFINQ